MGGEVRGINQVERRIKEGEKLGFKKCVIPESNYRNLKENFKIEVSGVRNLKEALSTLLKKASSK